MRPTSRGVGVLLVAVAATVVGARYGQQALGAVAAPLYIALLGAAVQVYRSGPLTVERSSLRRGFPGESHELELSVEGSGIASITDRRPAALGGDGTATRALPTTVTVDVPYDDRGEHELGPVEVTLTDTLGLVVARTTVDATDTVLVYPEVHRIGGESAFLSAVAPAGDDRQTFDRLREYAPGDSLRDIHWKSSAKRDDLLVTEFAEHSGDRGLLVAAQAAEGTADGMAAAAATVATSALQREFAVGLETPDETVERGSGEGHRLRILEALARTGDGTCRRADDADVLVSATAEGVIIEVDGRQQSFEGLSAGVATPVPGRGSS